MNEEQTPAWQSKTLWCAVLVAAAPMFPPVTQAIIASPMLCGALVASLFAGLRLVTKTSIKVK